MSLTIDRPSFLPHWVDRVQYPFHDEFMDVDGGKMHYVDVGHGEPIVFLHGLPTWSFIYRHLIRSLAQDFRCVAPDMIGFGLSDKPQDWSYSPLTQARNLETLIDGLGLKNVTLVMHDYGASVGMSYAVDHPHNVRRVVVFNGTCWDLKGDFAAERIGRIAVGGCGRLMMETMNGWPKIVRRTFGDRSTFAGAFQEAIAGPTEKREDRHGLWLTAKNLIESSSYFDDVWRRRTELEELPLLLLWGMSDPHFGEKALNRWWHEFPLAEVMRLEGVGHFPMQEKPAEVLKDIRSFMAVTRRGNMPYLV